MEFLDDLSDDQSLSIDLFDRQHWLVGVVKFKRRRGGASSPDGVNAQTTITLRIQLGLTKLSLSLCVEHFFSMIAFEKIIGSQATTSERYSNHHGTWSLLIACSLHQQENGCWSKQSGTK